jgi:thioesterase-3
VNNARYLEFLEEARWNWLQPGISSGEIDPENYSFVLVNLNISYRMSVKAGDEIEVKVRDLQIGNASLSLKQEVILSESGNVAAEAEVKFVIINIQSNRPVPIDQIWRKRLEALFQ